MGFVTVTPTCARNGGSRSNDVTYANTQLCHKQASKQSVFRIPACVMQELRWMAGDLVVVMIDESDRTVFIRRAKPTEGGFTLSASTTVDGKTRTQMKGEPCSCRVSISFRPPLPSTNDTVSLENVRITGEGILAAFPAGCVFGQGAAK